METSEDEVRAFGFLQSAAEAGHADAAFHVGVCLLDGLGTTQDMGQALRWIRTAVRANPIPGYSEVLCTTPWQLLHDSVIRGWAPDPPSDGDLSCYRRLAESGLAEAEGHLGLLHSVGFGLARDPGLAAMWFRRGAVGGCAIARWLLAMALAQGDGVPQNVAEALFWLRSTPGYMPAATYRGELRRDLLASALADIQSSDKTLGQGALGTLRELSEDGFAEAQFQLATLLLSLGASYEEESRKWLEAAAERGNAPAQNLLGLVLLNGNFESRDEGRAATWLERAARQGEVVAQYHLARLFGEGRGVPQSSRRAYFWIRLASISGLSAEYADGAQSLMASIHSDIDESSVQELNASAGAWQPTDEVRAKAAADLARIGD